MKRKRVWKMFKGTITLAVWIIGGYVLHRFEYLNNLDAIDNVIGMLPVALMLFGAGGITFLLWGRQSRRFWPVSVMVGFLIFLSFALFPTALRSNWWLNMTISQEQEAKVDLTPFIPFSENSKNAKLGEDATLRLEEDLPILDGATALYPIYAAFAEAVYAENAFFKEAVLCSNTREAYSALMAGERDIIFVAGASEQQLAKARAANIKLHFTPIGREAFVFLVGNENPVDNVTEQQIRNIYSGKTANWSTLGWKDGGEIIPFQRPEGSGSQTGLQKMMGDLPIQVPQPLPDASLMDTNSLMKQVSLTYQGVQPAMGYSYRYYATTMFANPEAKLLKVNGVEPSIENIQNGSYPFVADFYAVTKGEPEGNTQLLIEWILSEQGQTIIEQTGYTPIIN